VKTLLPFFRTFAASFTIFSVTKDHAKISFHDMDGTLFFNSSRSGPYSNSWNIVGIITSGGHSGAL
jgi:hypothetical protein